MHLIFNSEIKDLLHQNYFDFGILHYDCQRDLRLGILKPRVFTKITVIKLLFISYVEIIQLS